MTPNIPISAWSPDSDLTQPGVLADVYNLVPTRRGYAPEYSLEDSPTYTDAIDAEPFGSETVQLSNGTFAPLVGTRTKLFHLSSAGLQDRGRSTAYVAPTIQDAAWRFFSFGTDTYAINYDNTLQRTTSISTTDFSDVSGGPKAFTACVQRNFAIVGNIKDGTYAGGDAWLCSKLEDPTNWTPDIATQSAAGRLTATPGPIVRLMPFRDNVIAFKNRSFYRGQYVGAAANTWAWPVVSTHIGLIGHDAVCEADGVLYWLAEDGFYRWAGGAVDRIASAPYEWLYDTSDGAAFLQYAQAIFDPTRRVVRWIISIPGPEIGRLVVSYHPDTDRWGKSYLDVYRALYLWSDSVPTVTDTTDIYRTLPIGYIGSDLSPKLQTGTPGTSSFTTGDIGDDDDAFVVTRTRARFLIAPATSSVTHYHRMNLGDALTTGETATRSDGKYDITHSARWHRLKFEQTGRYEVTGFRVESPRVGKR